MRQVIFDTETTGLGPGHRIVSLAAIEMVDGLLTGKFAHWHLNPGRPCDPGAAAIHGLADDYLATQPKFIEIEPELDAFVSNARMVIHNAQFDLRMLRAEQELVAAARGNRAIFVLPPHTCTFVEAEKRRGRAKGRNTLDTLAREWGVQNLRELTGKHGALVDCLVLYGVFRFLAGRPPVPLVQSQIDHFLSKGFGVHGGFTEQSPGSTAVPAPSQPDAPGVGPDVRAVG